MLLKRIILLYVTACKFAGVGAERTLVGSRKHECQPLNLLQAETTRASKDTCRSLCLSKPSCKGIQYKSSKNCILLDYEPALKKVRSRRMYCAVIIEDKGPPVTLNPTASPSTSPTASPTTSPTASPTTSPIDVGVERTLVGSKGYECKPLDLSQAEKTRNRLEPCRNLCLSTPSCKGIQSKGKTCYLLKYEPTLHEVSSGRMYCARIIGVTGPNPTASPIASPTASPSTSPIQVGTPTGPTASPAPCQTLYEAIVKDNMPPSSGKCVPSSGTTSSDFNFVSSQQESQWFLGYQKSYDTYNAPWSQLEQYVFNAKMVHTDPSVNRTWTLRLGKGGNIYSLVGPMGETVSPQKRVDSPWIDEIWHSVSSDPIKNVDNSNSAFMIHGGGSYQSDQTYQSDKGVPLTKIPFYSPSLGKYCNDEDGECGFVAWPQHGPVAVDHKSTNINFNRYKDCGDGVIEHTAVVHNNMGSTSWPSRIDAPLGSVRFSNLRDVVVTHKDTNSEEIIEPHELGRYDLGEAFKQKAEDTLGYAIFAEDLPSKNSGPYPLKSGIQLKVHPIGCRTAPDLWAYPVVMCRIEPTTTDTSSARVAVTYRGTPAQINPPCSTNNQQNCITQLKFIKYGSGTYCRPFGSDISCRLDNDFLNNFVNGGGDANNIKFRTDSGKVFTASNGINNWSIEFNGLYSLIYTRSSSDTSLDDINIMIESDNTAAWNIEFLTPPEAGGDVHAKNGVAIWVNKVAGPNTYWTHFYADNVPGVSDIGAYVAKRFPPGSTLDVLYHTGKPVEDNTALAHVYGNNFDGVRGLTNGWPLVWIGNANEGKKPRDLNVYNIVTTANENRAGGIHYYRQYFAMDTFSDISSTAASWVDEVITDNYNVIRESAPLSRTVDIFTTGVDESSIRAVVGKSGMTGSVCTGSTTPNASSMALFHIKCGDATYIGADPYHFAPSDWSGNGYYRPYICANDNAARGVWNLLGFFPDNACSDIQTGYTFFEGDNMCVTE